MVDVNINIKDNAHRFFVGDTISGTVDMVLPESVPLSNVMVTFHCLGEVKWVEYPGTPYYLNGFVYYDKYSYLELEYPLDGQALTHVEKDKSTQIPFEFTVPKE